ncbi:MAG: dCTP deaminase [Nitrospirota bacterium]
MMLKADHIADLLEGGNNINEKDPLVITPSPDLCALKKSGAASVDLRLGCWFVTLRNLRISHLTINDSTSDEPQEQITKMQYVPFGTEYYLHPRSFVLGVTLEWLRIPKDLGGYIVGRSRWGRRGLVIATAAGVHPGFTGCLALELSNLGEIPIAIKPGMTISQLFLHQAIGAQAYVDKSTFIGTRKPILGQLQSDETAMKLATPL